MQVSLKVVGGKNDGREISISVPRFIIGRGETAHLRPASDLVSREHTAIEIGGGKVIVRDLGSRNGTYVNGVRISAAHEARAGDGIRVGRLQFEVLLDPVKPGLKNPRVTNVAEAAARTATSKKAALEDSITDWLLESGDDEELGTIEKEQISSAETIQLNLEDTTKINKDSIPEEEPVVESEDDTGKSAEKRKVPPMKMPLREKIQHLDSTSAADDVLKKFFNRR
jgi:pSer/pThr/pTyr-binding forkhead associated (FHA) protein